MPTPAQRHKSLREFLDLQADVSLKLVHDADAIADDPARRLTFQSNYSDRGLPDYVWTAFWLNIVGMRGVMRKTGRPYATHPITVAQIGLELLGRTKKTFDIAAMCLLHDYLEEGPGFTHETFTALKKEMKLFPDAALGAVLLSEPQIDYTVYKFPKRIMEYIAYVQQILMIKDRVDDRFICTSLLDKIHNAHCWDYIVLDDTKYAEESKRDRKIGVKLAHYAFVNHHLGSLSEKELSEMLGTSIEYFSQHFGFDAAEIAEATGKMEDVRTQTSKDLIKQIEGYHATMKIWQK